MLANRVKCIRIAAIGSRGGPRLGNEGQVAQTLGGRDIGGRFCVSCVIAAS